MPRDGGGTRHFELGRELVRRGWSVTIAASDFHLHQRRYTRRLGEGERDVVPETLDGVEFQWFWAAAYQRNDWRRGWNWLSFARSLQSYNPAAPRPDVVLGSSPHLFAALAGQRLAHRWRVPFVLEVRDLWPESLLAVGGRKGPAYFALERIARYLYHRADRIVCLARGSVRHLAGLGVSQEKLVLVPNGVDPRSFPDVVRPPRDTFTLVYAGAHGPANGLDTVVDAAYRLRDRPEIRFLLVGDGPSKPALMEDARRRGLTNLEFRDSVPKLQMPAVLAEADAGLMVLKDTPLFSFGVSPNKLFDYFGASLPVVCNVPGEVAEMVCAAGGGEQTRDSSAAALADGIHRLAARPPEDRAALGRAAREWVVREHGRDVLADRLDRHLRPLLRQ